jgi:AcrR family transcriptional regulator
MLKKEPKQARSEQMVSCILAGATRVLNAVPLANATTNRIAEVAGVSVGSLYQYFDGKESIGICLVEKHLEETVSLLRDARIGSQGYSAMRRMRMSFIEVLRDHRRGQTLHRSLIGVAKTSKFSSAATDHIDRIIDELAQVLREERPEACEDRIKLCATLSHQNATLLVHSAVCDSGLDKDSLVIDHFDALNAANLKSLDADMKSRRRRVRARAAP